VSRAPEQGRGLAAGVVRVRLSGAAADIDALAALFLGGTAARAGVEVIETSARYLNRREPGERLYLTLRLMNMHAAPVVTTPGPQRKGPSSKKEGTR
jgi:hypothetical protein